MNLDSRASYRHGGRGPLPTDPVIKPPFKTLTGEAPGTRCLTEPPALRSTQQVHDFICWNGNGDASEAMLHDKRRQNNVCEQWTADRLNFAPT
jgi:hypothetical protein